MVTMFLIVIIPLFAASIFLLVSIKDIVKEKSEDASLYNSDVVRFRILDTVDSAEAVMSSIVENKDILGFLENDYTEKKQYYDFYSSYTSYEYYTPSPQIENICIFSEREDMVYSSIFHYADEETVSQSWYSNVIESGRTLWNVIKNPEDGEYSLACLSAIRSGERVIGVAAVAVSGDWICSGLTDERFGLVLSVNNGVVFYSDEPSVELGSVISPSEDFMTTEIRKLYDYPFFGSGGYTVLNNFYSVCRFQIILLIPSSYMTFEINRLSVVYGSYCALMIILSILTIILFTSVFSRRIKILSDKMHSVAAGNFDIEFDDHGNDEISALYYDLGQMIADMRRLINDNYQVKIESETFKLNQKEAEFKALASQINPHFLYNTLETIRMKAYCNNDKETADLVKKLGKFMRRCLEFKDGAVTLRSELEFTNSYLELQSARFGDRVSYNIYSEISKDYMILPLLIQPIVENAFVHGIEGNKTNGHIDIRVYYRGNNVIVDVKDNGQGMSPEKLRELNEKLEISDTSSGKSIGLTNVHKRIKMYHGEQYGMSIASREGEGTTITLTLPRKPVSRLSSSDNVKELEMKKNV